ncbi:MAG: hypothetical protein HC837_20400 [Chloroflexaceae bacterium]|nr:hypothetical protein [Chloroflexaceae bacterium]
MEGRNEQQISLDHVPSQFAEQLKHLGDTALTITDGGEAVGVLLSPQVYARIRRAQAYLQMLTIAAELRSSGITADELTQGTRAEREARGW